MGLEFKVKDIDVAGRFLVIDAQGGDGQACINLWIEKGEDVANVDSLDSKHLLELGIFINLKIGYDLFNITLIKEQVKRDEEYWTEIKKQNQ